MVCHNFRQKEFMKRHIPILLGATAPLDACSTPPSSGPTGRKVLRTSAEDKQLGLSVVEVDSFAATPPIQADEKGKLGVGFGPPCFSASACAGHVPGTADSVTMGRSLSGAIASSVMRRA
jgi:hypothetical protein